jgi:hypothetical protein
MGIDFYIGDDQVRITNAFWYNRFLNWAAKMGNYPQILDHSPIHGEYVLENIFASNFKGSVFLLEKELEELKTLNPPTFIADIIEYMLDGIESALDKQKKITMDDGAWFGD